MSTPMQHYDISENQQMEKNSTPKPGSQHWPMQQPAVSSPCGIISMTKLVRLAVEATARQHKLTYRQRECVALLVQGYTYKDIARQMGIALDTVKSHLRWASQNMGHDPTLDRHNYDRRVFIIRTVMTIGIERKLLCSSM